MANLTDLSGRVQALTARAPKGLIRFLSVGMVGLATHTGIFTLLFHLGLAKSPAWLCGLAAGTVVTWQLNRRMTFAASGRRRSSEAVRYILVTAVAQAVSFGVFRSICALEPGVSPTLALIFGAVVATLFSYSGQRFFTFAAPKSVVAAEPGQEVPIA
jgi:putative flippase GtrA